MSAAVPPPARRWAVSFADLALLIACTLLLGWRPDSHGSAPGAATASPALRAPVSSLFLDGEALLSAQGEQALRSLRDRMGDEGSWHIMVGMRAGGSHRLDAWELAAARTATLARVLEADQPVSLAAPAADSGDVVISRR